MNKMQKVNLELIKKLRKERHISQEEMAKRLGFNTQYPYHRKESGKQPFHADEIYAIAIMFEKPIEYFFSNRLAKNASEQQKKRVVS